MPLPGGRRASQSDIFVLARNKGQLVSIAVEGKVSEPFRETVAEWKSKEGKGKKARLDFLCSTLGLREQQTGNVRYQLLHRTASALILADTFKAGNALMLVHSFSQSYEWFDDYCRFLALFGVDGSKDSLVFAKNIAGVDLYFAWVKGDSEFLRG